MCGAMFDQSIDAARRRDAKQKAQRQEKKAAKRDFKLNNPEEFARQKSLRQAAKSSGFRGVTTALSETRDPLENPLLGHF